MAGSGAPSQGDYDVVRGPEGQAGAPEGGEGTYDLVHGPGEPGGGVYDVTGPPPPSQGGPRRKPSVNLAAGDDGGAETFYGSVGQRHSTSA